MNECNGRRVCCSDCNICFNENSLKLARKNYRDDPAMPRIVAVCPYCEGSNVHVQEGCK